MHKLRDFYEDLKNTEAEMINLQRAISHLDSDTFQFSKSILMKEYDCRKIKLNNRLDKECVINPRANTIVIDD